MIIKSNSDFEWGSVDFIPHCGGKQYLYNIRCSHSCLAEKVTLDVFLGSERQQDKKDLLDQEFFFKKFYSLLLFFFRPGVLNLRSMHSHNWTQLNSMENSGHK